MVQTFDSFPANPDDGHKAVIHGVIFRFDAANRAWRVVENTSGGDKDLNHYRLTNVQAPRVGGALDPGKNDAVNREYVDELVASSALYQGTWYPATNTPDLTPRPNDPKPFPLNGYSWVVTTADPLLAEIVPDGLPGIEKLEVRSGDTVKWSTTASQYQLIKAASFNKSDTDKLYAKLLGGFGTYTAGQDYPVGRMVQYNGGFYQVTTAILNAPAIPDDSKWQSFGGILQTEADTRYASLVGGFGTWQVGQHYEVGRILHHDGLLFQVITDIPSSGTTPDPANWKPLGAQQTDYWQGQIAADPNWVQDNWVLLADLPAYFMGEVVVTSYLALNQSCSYRLYLMGAFGSANMTVQAVRSAGSGSSLVGPAMFSEFRVSAAVKGQPMRLEAKIQDAVSTSPTMKIVVAGTTYGVVSGAAQIPDPPAPLPGKATLGGVQYVRMPAEPSAAVASKVQTYTPGARYRVGELVGYDNQLFEVTTLIDDATDPPNHSLWRLHGDSQAGYYQGGVLAQTWLNNNWAKLAELPPYFTGEVLIVADANINYGFSTRINITSIGDRAEMRVLDTDFGRGGKLFKQFRLSRDGGPLRLEAQVGGGSGASVVIKVVVKGTDPDGGPNHVEMPLQIAALPAAANLGGNELALVTSDATGAVGSLDDLLDVTLTSPSTGQSLVYDGTGWVNDSVTSPIVFMGTGAWVAANIGSKTDNYGMAADTQPSPQLYAPLPGDQYIDLGTGNVTVFTGAATTTGGRADPTAGSVSTITAGVSPADLTPPMALHDLTDVAATAPVDGDVLQWSATGATWEPHAPATGTGGSVTPRGVGEIIPWMAATVPDGYLPCNGQVVAVAAYPDLYAVIGNTYNTGTGADGTSTFALPDLRGYFLRGIGARGGEARVGVVQEDTTRRPRNTNFTTDSQGSHQHPLRRYLPKTWGDTWEHLMNYAAGGIRKAGGGWEYYNEDKQPIGTDGAHTHTITGGGDPETRPKSVSVQWLIRVHPINGGAPGPKGDKGDNGDSGAVGDLWTVGSIQQSMLSESQFRTALGLNSVEERKWVLADGRDVSGSKYAQITGSSKVPDLRGAFLRMAGQNNNPAWTGGSLNGYQEDTTRRPRTNFTTDSQGAHTHSGATSSPSNNFGTYAAGVNNHITGYTGTTTTGSNGGHTHTVTGGGDTETRPKNYSVNYYIKVN